MKSGQGNMINGIVSLVIIVFVFAVSYPILDLAINTLQDQAGTTVDIISAGYLPIMAVVLFMAITHYLNPRRPEDQYGQQV